MLYETDFSGGKQGWAGGPEWDWVSGMLVNNGEHGRMSVITSAFQSQTNDYAVEAEMQIIRRYEAHCCDGLGVFARGSPSASMNAYLGGVTGGTAAAVINAGFDFFNCNNCLARKDFNPKKDWHTYRLELKGSSLRLLVDQAVLIDTTDTRFLRGPQSGIWVDGGSMQINVRRFKIVQL